MVNERLTETPTKSPPSQQNLPAFCRFGAFIKTSSESKARPLLTASTASPLNSIQYTDPIRSMAASCFGMEWSIRNGGKRGESDPA